MKIKHIVTAMILIIGWCAAGGESAENYRLELKHPQSIAANKMGEIYIKIIPTNGYKMNEQAPLSIAFKYPAEGIKLAKEKLLKSDALVPGAKEPEFKNQIEGLKAGEYEIEATLKFVICTEKDCQIKRVIKTLKIKITESQLQ